MSLIDFEKAYACHEDIKCPYCQESIEGHHRGKENFCQLLYQIIYEGNSERKFINGMVRHNFKIQYHRSNPIGIYYNGILMTESSILDQAIIDRIEKIKLL